MSIKSIGTGAAMIAAIFVLALAGATVAHATGTCGDGVVDPGEACDDGNNLPGDGCTAGCQLCDGIIGNFVWNDGISGAPGECDGRWPLDGSNGLNGLTVKLYDNDTGDLLRTTTTFTGPYATDGYYVFEQLCQGNYRVEVWGPSGFVAAPSHVGDSNGDSNGSPAYVSLSGDAYQDLSIDFGFCSPAAHEGCSPGYWKNHDDSWVAYSAQTTVGSVFTAVTTAFPTLANATLAEALKWGGGSTATDAARMLLRQAVSALLNTTNPGVHYPRTQASVIADTNAAISTKNRSTMINQKTAFDTDNNLGCPLSGKFPGGTE